MSAAIYAALQSFLDGNTGDVRTAVNAEQSGLLVAGSVSFSRKPRRNAPRSQSPFPVCVEIVPVTPRTAHAIGIGFEELDFAFDLQCSVFKKDKAQGKNQLQTVEDMARALVRRYRGMTNLSIPVAGGAATFVRSDAEQLEVDGIPEVGDRARALVRATFTFLEDQGVNT